MEQVADQLEPASSEVTDHPPEAATSVAGERGIGSINRVRSLQSRISSFLAIGLMSALGLGLLGWYYARTYSTQTGSRENAQTAARSKAKGDMPLPPLGEIEVPALAATPLAEEPNGLLGAVPEEPPPEDVPDAWLRPATDAAPPYRAAGTVTKSPEQLALERKLSGSAYSTRLDSPSVQRTPADVAEPPPPRAGVGGSPPWSPDARNSEASAGGGGEDLQELLRPTKTPAVRAQALPTQRLLLGKGAFIDCTLETAIDSTLPGMVTCVTATDTFGIDGTTVLLERGTKLVGETRGQVRQGSARVFVLWSEARTPTGVVVPLASPATDELGRSGLPGKVNRHFFERFGAAILISVIDGAVQGAVQSGNNGGAVIYNPTTSEDVTTEVLKSTINIPPTVTKRNGDRVQVLVARDLDFRSVYELKPSARVR